MKHFYSVNLDQRTTLFFKMLFDRHWVDQYAWTDKPGGDLAVVDLDLFKGRDAFNQFRQRHPDTELLVLSLLPVELPYSRVHFIQKPLRMTEVITLVDQLAAPKGAFSVASNEVLASRFQKKNDSAFPQTVLGQAPTLRKTRQNSDFYLGAQTDIPFAMWKTSPWMFYNPDDYLQGYLTRLWGKARDQGERISLSGLAFLPISLDPAKGHTSTAMPAATLFAASRQQIANQPPDVQPAAALAGKMGKEMHVIPIEDLLWRLGLWASRGRLPAGCDLEAPITLKRWPNLTRVPAPSETMEIVALWLKKPCTLQQTIEQFKLPHRVIFAVYSACMAAGLLVQPETAEAPTPSTTEVPKEKMGVMKAFLRRLITGRAQAA